MSAKKQIELRECSICKEALKVVRSDGREIAFDRISGEPHRCFDIPVEEEVLILED